MLHHTLNNLLKMVSVQQIHLWWSWSLLSPALLHTLDSPCSPFLLPPPPLDKFFSSDHLWGVSHFTSLSDHKVQKLCSVYKMKSGCMFCTLGLNIKRNCVFKEKYNWKNCAFEPQAQLICNNSVFYFLFCILLHLRLNWSDGSVTSLTVTSNLWQH